MNKLMLTMQTKFNHTQRKGNNMYYKILCDVTNEKVDAAILDLSNLEYLNKYNEVYNNNSSFYLYSLKSNILTILAITNHVFDRTENLESCFMQYSSILPIQLSNIDIKPITYFDYDKYVGDLNGFMTPENQNTIYLVDDFELEKHMIPNELGRFTYKETFVTETTFQILPELLQDYTSELNRIYSTTTSSFMGHPIHYHIKSEKVEDAETVVKSLITNLIKQKRILSNRLVKVRVNPRLKSSIDLSIALGQHMASGGSILFNLSSDLNTNEIKNILDQVSLMCLSINNTQHEVLYFFYTNENTEFFELMNKYLQIKTITIKPECLDYINSKEYLAKRFAESTLDLNRIEYILNEDKFYTLSQLDDFLSKEIKNNLVLSLYPKYKDFYEFKKDHLNTPVEYNNSGLKKLNELIGLKKVKQKIIEIVNANKNSKLFSNDFNISSFSNHMVFTGNPGTAKTTVARLLGQILKEHEILSVGDFYEVSRSDLIERYVGWTSKNVREVFQKAKGSVLFIDEAYSIMDNRSYGYGDEAISTILQEMENYRDDIVVIFAGYPKEMDQFINSNPGLKSRIKHFIQFDDYSVSELIKIASYISKQFNSTLTQDGLFLLTKYLVNTMHGSNFGNAREVRNIIEQAITVHLSNLESLENHQNNLSSLIISTEDLYFISENRSYIINPVN